MSVQPLRKKPDRCEPWQEIRLVGVGCRVHAREHIFYYYGREQCPNSEFFERRECEYESGWMVFCRVCETDVRDCHSHSLILETAEVVVIESSGGLKLNVFSKKDGRSFFVRARKRCEEWTRRALGYIKKYGMDARPDWRPAPETEPTKGRVGGSRIVDA